MAESLYTWEGSFEFIDEEIYFHRYMFPIFDISVRKHNSKYDDGDTIDVYYDDRLVDSIGLYGEYEYGKNITIDLENKVIWTGINHQIGIVFSNYDEDDVEAEYFSDSKRCVEDTGDIKDNIEYVAKKLAKILNKKGIDSNYTNGLTTLVKKVKTLDYYSPSLDGTDETTSIDPNYEFTTGNGYAGGYHQMGYLSDGFRNGSCDWELSMTLQSSQWDGGFVLLLTPYTSDDFTSCTESNKVDCIFKNNQNDILQWIDGRVKTNNGSTLSNTPITYTRQTTKDVKLVKNGNVFKYYEGNTLKGSYTWQNLANAERIYLGVFTWGNSGSVNRFSNVSLKRIRTD